MESKAKNTKNNPNYKRQSSESMPQEQFLRHIVKVGKGIQSVETEINGEKTNVLRFIVNKDVRQFISEEGDFLKVFLNDKINISPIQETKPASKQLDNILKKEYNVSITTRWCKMNNVNKVGRPPNFIAWAHTINSLLFILFNKGILNIDYDEGMTYVHISIDKDTDVEKSIFTSNKSNMSNKKSMDMNNKIEGLDDDDSDNDDD
jgi:hypothetical protein